MLARPEDLKNTSLLPQEVTSRDLMQHALNDEQAIPLYQSTLKAVPDRRPRGSHVRVCFEKRSLADAGADAHEPLLQVPDGASEQEPVRTGPDGAALGASASLLMMIKGFRAKRRLLLEAF
eukprot:760811-Hanusia_phi.AAC.1